MSHRFRRWEHAPCAVISAVLTFPPLSFAFTSARFCVQRSVSRLPLPEVCFRFCPHTSHRPLACFDGLCPGFPRRECELEVRRVFTAARSAASLRQHADLTPPRKRLCRAFHAASPEVSKIAPLSFFRFLAPGRLHCCRLPSSDSGHAAGSPAPAVSTTSADFASSAVGSCCQKPRRLWGSCRFTASAFRLRWFPDMPHPSEVSPLLHPSPFTPRPGWLALASQDAHPLSSLRYVVASLPFRAVSPQCFPTARSLQPATSGC